MAKTTLNKTNAPGAYASATQLVTMTAADVANGNQFPFSNKDLLIIQNTGAGAHTVTITSIADDQGRLGSITAENINAGEIKVFGPMKSAGWQQTDGYIYLSANHAEVKFGIITKNE
jgi:hypothetical protein